MCCPQVKVSPPEIPFGGILLKELIGEGVGIRIGGKLLKNLLAVGVPIGIQEYVSFFSSSCYRTSLIIPIVWNEIPELL